jgi:hypothetical protein
LANATINKNNVNMLTWCPKNLVIIYACVFA